MEKAKATVEKKLGELFSAFKAVDDALVPEHMRHAIRYLVARVEEIQIRIDGDKNHGRAHVHIKYKKDGHAASYAINDGARLAGKLPSYYDGLVSNWIANNRDDLIKLWESTQSGRRDEAILLKFQTTVYD
jgi:hypothetical protein